MVVDGLSKLSFKWLLLAPNLLSVVDSLSGLLAVAKGILFCFHMAQMKRQGRWWSFRVVNEWSLRYIELKSIPAFRVVSGRQRHFVLFPYGTNETTGSLVVFQGR